ncbi:MAG: glucose-6-phosphate dehydrogenase, partial [Acidimicrobiales bacterium]
TKWTDEEFQKTALGAVGGGERWSEMVRRFRYVSGEYGHKDTFDRLKEVLAETDRSLGTSGNRVFYLATIPDLFGVVASALAEHGCNQPGEGGSFARLVVEKPYGRDLDSALALDETLHSAFDESQIFRIDHYMGKETVQNLLALRFANAVFEPIWNRRYVDSVQITVAEELGVEHRGGFYEKAGALRDIVQNHVMQVLALTLMEPPATADAQGIRDEKVKLLRAIVVPSLDEAVGAAVRAQYTEGEVAGTAVPGYRQEEGVDPNSVTETYVAMQLGVENWRWAGVPVYVRTGKRLEKRATEVVLQFRRVPHLAFGSRLSRDLRANELVVRVQPDEGICLLFGAKVPGEAFRVRSVGMQFSYAEAFGTDSADAYERLLHDAMIGDPTLFIRTDEVDQAWRIVDPFLQVWGQEGVPLAHYPAGSWGPHEADLLVQRELRQWRNP